MKMVQSPPVKILIMAIVVTVAASAFAADDDITAFDKAIILQQIPHYVRQDYVDSIGSAELYNGAIEGMIEKLDPHSSYMPPRTAADFNERIRGNFEGIGITFAMINGKITVIEVIEGGPSEAAGLKSRDKIVRIGNGDVIGIDNDSVKTLLRGPKDSKVTVHIERPGLDELKKITITRDRVNINSVSHAFMVNDNTGYIKITKFTTKTHYDVSDALKKLDKKGMERLVLDLRNNSGGSLEASCYVVDKFISEKGSLIVETRGRSENEKSAQFKTSGKGRYADIPLVVMINHGSASASEVVSGALQDHDRALIVGQTSFGKGLVMNSYRLRNRDGKELGNLVLSTAHYYTPSGRLIQRPYINGRAEYIKEGLDDFDPNAADSTRSGQPVFYTDLNREVYGGGGITPDRHLATLPRLNKLESAIRRTNLVFEFTDSYLDRHGDVPSDFKVFLADYTVPGDEIDRFREFIESRDIDTGVDTSFEGDLKALVKKHKLPENSAEIAEKAINSAGIQTTPDLFAESRDFIAHEIKQEIARMKWGPEERLRVWHTEDTELIGAISWFDDAESLLKSRLAWVHEHEDSNSIE